MDATDDYEEAGIDGELGFGESPAVVVVDLQTGFTDPDSPLGATMDDTVAATADLLAVAREHDVPVYFTRCVYREDLRDAGVFAEKVSSLTTLTRGSDWLSIDPRLDRRDDEPVVEKRQPSAFFGTDLNTMLTHEDVDTTVVAGATTSGCVRATVTDAMSHGYRPIVPTECVGDRAERPHEANLFDMDKKYADVLDLADVTARLAAVAGEGRPVATGNAD